MKILIFTNFCDDCLKKDLRPVDLVSAIIFLYVLEVVKTAMEFGANLFQLMKFSNRQVIT